MTSATTTDIARGTANGWSRSALWLGILACVLLIVGFVAVSRIWPGDPLVIGIATALHYALPLTGLVVSLVARRREGRSAMSTIGLALSSVGLVGAVVPLMVDVLGLLL